MVLQVYNLSFNPKKIGDALCITENQVRDEFSDGRVISRFSEYWASRLYNFQKCKSSNEAGYDGTITLKLTKIKVGVRSLTKSGIKFQQSKYIGSGRNCNKQSLLKSVSNMDYEICVDIYRFPWVFFVPVEVKTLISMIYLDKLMCRGLSHKQFYNTLFNVDCPEELEPITVSAYSILK